jgi:hypothetical protein
MSIIAWDAVRSADDARAPSGASWTKRLPTPPRLAVKAATTAPDPSFIAKMTSRLPAVAAIGSRRNDYNQASADLFLPRNRS